MVPIDDPTALQGIVPTKPGQLRQEYAVDDVLRAAMEPAAAILRRLAPPQRLLFPPRVGYERNQLTINDVLALNRDGRPRFISGASIEPSPALRNVVGNEW